MTLRAHKVINSVDVLAIPQSNAWTKSLAWRICSPNIDEGNQAERLFLTFPMSRDPEVIKPHWDSAFQQIGDRLEQGKSVAFLTQGDPMVYSTFIYLYEHIRTHFPKLPIDIVPGISSISAVPGVTGIPLVDGQETFAVIPASYHIDNLRPYLRQFDSIVLMKVSSVMAPLIEILRDEGLLACATYVERGTSENQQIISNLEDVDQSRCVYFSMVIINKKERAGILAGKAPS